MKKQTKLIKNAANFLMYLVIFNIILLGFGIFHDQISAGRFAGLLAINVVFYTYGAYIKDEMKNE